MGECPRAPDGTGLAQKRATTLIMVNSVLRLTLLVSAIASATFAATLAFAPAVIELGQRALAASTDSAKTVSAAAQPPLQCGPFAKLVDVLGDGKACP